MGVALEKRTETYLNPSQTSEMELFCENVNGKPYSRKKAPSLMFDWDKPVKNAIEIPEKPPGKYAQYFFS